jgi:hypothetical protein
MKKGKEYLGERKHDDDEKKGTLIGDVLIVDFER